jgi:hypothetical protein
MLEVRVKQLQKQARTDFRYNESLNAMLVPFLRKEAVEKEVAEKEDDDDEEDQQADRNGTITPQVIDQG